MPSIEIENKGPEGVYLGEVEVGQVIAPDVLGQAVLVIAKNVRERGTISSVEIGLDGDGKGQVQLAVDVDGEAGTWAAAGMPILLEQPLAPGDKFAFWARAIPDHEGDAGDRQFEFVFRSVVKNG